MPKVTIDGREIEVAKGTTLLQAAERLGLEVPQMCYHPGLRVVGVCRVCLCQVKGWPKMTPACATEAGEGMEVALYSPEAEKARRAVIEFWLLNHPLDCPVCDQGGECPLQDIAFDHGPGVSRLGDAKVKKHKRVVLGPHVVLDEERCILCWRCTRFTQEVSESHQIMLRERGIRTVVGTPPGQVLDEPYSGNVVDICPVGALTSSDFRFKSRIWEMASSEGICTACSVGCNTFVWSKKGSVERLTARPNLRVNDYWLCDRGRYDIAFTGDAKRLRLPKLRVNERLIEVEWEDALLALTEGLRASATRGQNQAGLLAAPHLSNEEYWTFQKFVRATLGSNHLAAGRKETLLPSRVDLARRGRMLPSIVELENMDAILVLGGDLETTHPVYALRVRKAIRERGTKLYLATPDPGRLDGVAALAARIAPSGAGAWLSDLGAKLRSGADDPWVRGLSQVHRLAVIVNAGDGNEAVADVIEAFLGAGPKDSTWKTLLLDEGGNRWGASLLGVSPRYFPGMKAVAADEAQVWRSRWGGRVSSEPGLGWSEMVRAAGEGKMQSLLLVNSGRPVAWNFTPAERAAIGKVPFVAAFDLFGEEVDALAHVILPSVTFAEIDATYTTSDGTVQLARRNVVPRGPSPVQVLCRVAAMLGTKLKGPDPIDVFREMARDVPQYAGLDYGKASRGEARTETAALAGAGSRS
jgi:NADH-quinone oxidoreductase subunit G